MAGLREVVQSLAARPDVDAVVVVVAGGWVVTVVVTVGACVPIPGWASVVDGAVANGVSSSRVIQVRTANQPAIRAATTPTISNR